MDMYVNLESHAENLKFVKEISDEIISGVLNIANENVKSGSQKHLVSDKPDSGINLCDNEFEDFKDVQWIVLDEWGETSDDNFLKSNADKCIEKSKYSIKRKSYRKVDDNKKTGYGKNNNIEEKDFIPNYDSIKVSKGNSIDEGNLPPNFYTKSTFVKFPEDKFYCEICDTGFDLYENAIIHVEASHKLSKATNVSALVRLPRNPQMLKMFCCALPNCPNSFSGSSASLLKCHTLTMHEDLHIYKTVSLMFCQLCKGDPFENEDALDLHLVSVHGANTGVMKAFKKTPAYYYCIVCCKPIGSSKTWGKHASAPPHRYRKSKVLLAQENGDIEDEALEEAVVMPKREFSACKKEYELRELAKRRKNIKSYGTKKSILSRLGPKMIPCMNCKEVLRKDDFNTHIRTKHPHASFHCKFFSKYKLQPCGKSYLSSKKTLTHLRTHWTGIRMCEAIDRGLVKIPHDLRWMKCRVCGWSFNGQDFQAMVDHVREKHPEGASCPARITDFGCRLCGVVARGVRGNEKLKKHIKEKKMKSIVYNKKL